MNPVHYQDGSSCLKYGLLEAADFRVICTSVDRFHLFPDHFSDVLQTDSNLNTIGMDRQVPAAMIVRIEKLCLLLTFHRTAAVVAKIHPG